MLASLLSVPTGARYPALDMVPQRRREKTLEIVLALLERLAGRRPVVLLFEDAHWADPTSLEFFERIVDRSAHLPLLVVVTARPEFLPPWLDRPQVAMIALLHLPREYSAELIANTAGRKELPHDIAQRKSPTAPTACRCSSRSSPRRWSRAARWSKPGIVMWRRDRSLNW